MIQRLRLVKSKGPSPAWQSPKSQRHHPHYHRQVSRFSGASLSSVEAAIRFFFFGQCVITHTPRGKLPLPPMQMTCLRLCLPLWRLRLWLTHFWANKFAIDAEMCKFYSSNNKTATTWAITRTNTIAHRAAAAAAAAVVAGGLKVATLCALNSYIYVYI